MMIARKDVVTIRSSEVDGFSGGVWTVVNTTGSDALLIKGDCRDAMPYDETAWDLAINVRRLDLLA